MKQRLSKFQMSGWAVLALAVLAGLYTGLVMCVPSLEDTSFQDIGITYECWVILAVWIVTRCKKNIEAALKCFAFFLISQPLVYLVEVALGKLSFESALHYYLTIWLPMTLLTLPGGFVAFYAKKQNGWGSIILALGNTILVGLGVFYFIRMGMAFPHHLLTTLFCFASVFVLSFALQKKKKYRLVAILLPFVLAGIVILLAKLNGLYLVSNVF